MATIDLSLPTDAILLHRVNEAYGKNYRSDEVYFDTASLRAVNHAGCDTEIIMRGHPGTSWTGAARVYYNRINLTKYLAGQVVAVPDTLKFTGEARQSILDEIGIRLESRDIISDVIPPGATTGLLRISKQSLIYAGAINLSYGEVSGDLLSDRIRNLLLNGFYRESVEVLE